MTQLPDGRYIDDAPYSDQADLSALERSDMDAPNWVLVWRKFKRHKLGLISGLFLLICYLILPVAGFIAPYTANERSADYLYVTEVFCDNFERPRGLTSRKQATTYKTLSILLFIVEHK